MGLTLLTVLVMADDARNGTWLRHLLAKAPHAELVLETAETLAAGLTRVHQGTVDVALLDLSLPESQGLETVVTFCAQAPDVPLVVLTDIDEDEMATQVVQAGAHEYLVKGHCDSTRLVRAIRHAWERHRRYAALPQGLREAQAPAACGSIRECLIQHSTCSGEVTHTREEGSTFIGHASASVLRDDHGTVTGVMESARDVPAHKHAEQALQHAHQRTAQVLAALPSILIGLDADAKITWWNAAAERTFALAAAEVIGQAMPACQIPWDAPTILDGLATCRSIKKVVALDDIRFQSPDGTERLLGLTVTPMPDTSDDGTAFLLLGADITERKALQRQLAQAQKLEAIGQLAAGIAHEINTPTQYVGDNTRFLQDAFRDLGTLLDHYATLLQAAKAGEVPADLLGAVDATIEALDVAYLTAEIPAAIAQSLEGIERITTIVQAMKDFSHPGSEDKTAIDLNKAIASTLIVARNEWKYVADVVTDFDSTLPLVPCFPGELNQVVLNLMVNAAHAIADVVGDGAQGKGTITVRTHRDGHGVAIRLTDTGTGIPEAVRHKIFDPFFTTKEVGKGTGQGLAIAHDVIVKKHQGTLTYETAEGQGTTFIIRLPLDISPAAHGDAA